MRVLATLLTEANPTDDGFSFVQVVTVFVVLAVVWPLLTRLRSRLSQQRRERWSATESGHDEAETTDDRARPLHD